MGRHGKECRHKLTAEGDRIIYESDFFTIEYGAGKNRCREVTRFRDRDSAKAYLHELESRAEKRRTGMLDSRLEAYEDHSRRPLAEHVSDYLAVKKAEDKTPKHVAALQRHLEWMVAEIRAETLADITATQVTLAIGRMKDAGASLRTCNSYLTSMKAFVKWCLLDKRLIEDVLLAVAAYDHATDPRHPRRAPSVDEIHRLLDTARSRPAEQCGFFGEDRAMAYETSFLTGFRANEIRSLTPENYDVEGDHPCIIMRPRNSKRRRLDIQPLPAVAVTRFSKWLTGKTAGRRIFEKMPRDTARMLRADLTLARAAWIAEAATTDERRRREESDFLKYENSVGEFFDFHACRHGYITLISETCKSVKQAQTLARVSTPKLLDRYSHIQLHGMQQAADEVGRMLANGAVRQSGRPREAAAAPLAATGTDDEKPAPANRSSRGASRGNSPASGGRTRHAVAGWANCDAQSSEPSDQPASGQTFMRTQARRRVRTKAMPPSTAPVSPSRPTPMSPPGTANWSSFFSALSETMRERMGVQRTAPSESRVTVPGRISTSSPRRSRPPARCNTAPSAPACNITASCAAKRPPRWKPPGASSTTRRPMCPAPTCRASDTRRYSTSNS
jgi:integrase